MTDNVQQDVLKRFIWLEKQIRQAKDIKHLSFIMTNHSKRFLPYTQAVVWKKTLTSNAILSVSAIASINRKSPYVVWVENRLIPELNKLCGDAITVIQKEQLPKDIQEDWTRFLSGNVLYCPLPRDDEGQIRGGILYIDANPWNEAQLGFVGELRDVFQYAWLTLLKPPQVSAWKKFWKKKNRLRIFLSVTIILILIFILPVRQTVLAPAEVAPREPILVSPSIDGVIKTVDVKPNQLVKKEQVLFTLDKITLENQLQQAERELAIAEEKYRRAYQHAYTAEESKAELSILEAEVGKARNELTYSKALLARSYVRAAYDGVIIFSSPKHWLGRPVKVGEQVMLLAAVDNKQLDIEVPVSDMIQLKKGDKVRFFSNINPLKGLKAKIEYASFIARPEESKDLTYHVVALFASKQKIPRYGLHGTAKIYGDHISFFYYLFRRPIVFLQSLLGI